MTERLLLALRGPVDLATVDALTRLRLAGCRVGLDIRLQDADPDLRDLLALVGLDGLLLTGASAVEMVRETEAGEQPGVEEVVEMPDPPA